MNRYHNDHRTRIIGFGLATALGFAVVTGMGAMFDNTASTPHQTYAQVAAHSAPAATEVAINPGRIEVIAVREHEQRNNSFISALFRKRAG